MTTTHFMTDGLVREVESLMDGADIHWGKNLIGAYLASREACESWPGEEFAALKEEAERNLRAFLVKLRTRRALQWSGGLLRAA